MKARRQDKIIELIQEHEVETQEELADLLSQAGYQVKQASVSRDIRELNLTKVSIDGKGQKYVVLQSGESGMNERYTRVLRSGFVSMDMAQNILVINTVSGMAMAVAAALDALQIKEIVGSIAGDDTIMCEIRSAEQTKEAMQKIEEALGR